MEHHTSNGAHNNGMHPTADTSAVMVSNGAARRVMRGVGRLPDVREDIEVMLRKLPTLTCLVVLLLVSSGFQQKRKLSEAEAIRKAEEFIAQQGYADVPPVKDKSKWSPDPVWGKPDDLEMRTRRGSLLPRAYGVAKGERWWTVVFRMDPNHGRYKEVIPDYNEMVKKVGRAVTMDAYGGRIRMEHQTYYLEFAGLKKLAR